MESKSVNLFLNAFEWNHDDVSGLQAWLIVIGLVLITSVHVIHLYFIYIREKKKGMLIVETLNVEKNDPIIDKNQKINMIIPSTDTLREDAVMTRF